MSEPKSFASLSSGLLARKGGAKPAMRPQGFGQMGVGMEDLGWNDMGYGPSAPLPMHPEYLEEQHERVPSSISALTPAPRGQADAEQAETESCPPPVVEQQRAIAASFGDEGDAPVAKAKARSGAAVVSLPPRQASGRSGKKAAFTLRLDTERHLRLRLACAVTHRSAQQIVSQALAEYLDTLPELDVLADQLPAKLGRRS